MKYLIVLVLILLFFFLISINTNNNTTKFSEIERFDSVVIVGTAKNVEQYLPVIMKKMEDITLLFNRWYIIIYENDSTDNTLKVLQDWGMAMVISEKGIKGPRTHVLANARNILLEEALKLNTEYIMIMDMDDKNLKLTNEGILSSLNSSEDWAVMGANQEGQYYDLWALRTFDDWTPCDVWNDKNCKQDYKDIPIDSPLIEVKSCFGGFAIYKTKYLNNCKYDGISNKIKDEKCEHVSLNECIIHNGGKIYINPKMINS